MTPMKIICPLSNSKGIMSRNLKASSRAEEEEHLRPRSEHSPPNRTAGCGGDWWWQDTAVSENPSLTPSRGRASHFHLPRWGAYWSRERHASQHCFPHQWQWLFPRAENPHKIVGNRILNQIRPWWAIESLCQIPWHPLDLQFERA